VDVSNGEVGGSEGTSNRFNVVEAGVDVVKLDQKGSDAAPLLLGKGGKGGVFGAFDIHLNHQG
jgi:hypothetical protein